MTSPALEESISDRTDDPGIARYFLDRIYNIDFDENGPHEHLWGNTAPNTEDNRSHSLQEGSNSLTENYTRWFT